TPKLHMGDTGLACALMGIDAATLLKERERLGRLLETFVLQELRRQASWRSDPIEFFHYRDRDDFEVWKRVIRRAAAAHVGVAMRSCSFRGFESLRVSVGRATSG